MEALADWLAQTALSRVIIEPPWMVPAVQTVHILALAVALTAAVLMELQQVRAVSDAVPAVDPRERFMPWLLPALVILSLSGLALVVGEPHRTLPNPLFQTKMILLLVVLSLLLVRRNDLGAPATRVSRTSVLAGAVASLVLWIAIVTAGRWIAYVSG